MSWYGTDPGGKGNFGVARLEADGTFRTWKCSSVDHALQHIDNPMGVGIDAPLWWSSGEGGGRHVDKQLRKKYRIIPGTVQSANSLRGAALVQGVVLAFMLRKRFPTVKVTETHPKALLLALGFAPRSWNDFSGRFHLNGKRPGSDHERDALVGAVVVREALCGRWKVDLALRRNESELGAEMSWFGDVNYWWPESIEDS